VGGIVEKKRGLVYEFVEKVVVVVQRRRKQGEKVRLRRWKVWKVVGKNV
jgi:hypothetical protein